MCSITQHCLTLWSPMNYSPSAPLSMRHPRQEYWSGVPFPSLGNLPNPGVEPISLESPASASGFSTTSATWEALNIPSGDVYYWNISSEWSFKVFLLLHSLTAVLDSLTPIFLISTQRTHWFCLWAWLIVSYQPQLRTLLMFFHMRSKYQHHFLVDAKAKCVFIISGVFL